MNFTVYDIPEIHARAAFSESTTEVFKEQKDTVPIQAAPDKEYMPWGEDNNMPYKILDLIEKDETLSTCQLFNAEVCYGSGLKYNTNAASAQTKAEIEDFLLDCDLPTYFLGVCQDLKHFAFAVSVILLNADATRIVRVVRKEACYCRFAPAGKDGNIPYILYANWRMLPSADDIERIELLDSQRPWADFKDRIEHQTRQRKFAILTRVPTPDSTYYPIPYYASLFKGSWFNIKQLIGIAKQSKLKNSAPIKYHIEISARFWDGIFKAEGITDRKKQQDRIIEEKQNIIKFLTGMENSGKVLFSTFYVSPDGQEQHDVVINQVDTGKEGGDWESDIAEAINMICFTMRVHSNLVGSVPGKTQTNNSGSDKRELYTIAQALQKPYHDLLFTVHRIIIKFNRWANVFPETPFIQLTTLEENRDAKQVSTESDNNNAPANS